MTLTFLNPNHGIDPKVCRRSAIGCHTGNHWSDQQAGIASVSTPPLDQRLLVTKVVSGKRANEVPVWMNSGTGRPDMLADETDATKQVAKSPRIYDREPGL